MDNWLEIAGISLQLVAGFAFVFKQVLDELFSKEFIERIVNSLKRNLTVIAGEPKRRQKVAFVTAIVILPIAIAFIIKYNTSDAGILLVIGLTVATVWISWDIYQKSLKAAAKLLGMWERLDRKIDADDSFRMLTGNIFVFVISVALLITSGYIGDWYLHSSHELVKDLYILVFLFVGFPIFIMSSSYLAVLTFQQCLYWLKDMPKWLFWVPALILWTVGGIFLLVSKCL